MAIKNPFDISIEDIGKQKVELPEPIEIMELRRMVGILLEDAEGFIRDAALAQKSGRINKTERDQVMTRDETNYGRELKKIYNKHADRAFLNSLNTVHWTGDEYALQYVKDVPSKDELSTTVSLPGQPFLKPRRVSYGLWVKGFITFAANNMDHIHSGHRMFYYPGSKREEERFSDEQLKKAKQQKRSSGINKVPLKIPHNFDTDLRSMDKGDALYHENYFSRYPYILDAETFQSSPRGTNEALVDNWSARGIIVTDQFLLDNLHKITPGPQHNFSRVKKLFELQEHWKVPLYDINGEVLVDAPPEGGWP